ncbi:MULTISPECIES: PaaI family thioesterase [Rhodococcus]|uniref:PaaI family thioesterase n=1 Tax=Rhodococcus oxybenzonivorans TaxID=1990687 RepID=A0AAE5A543_9NOCA|nr:MULTISPECIES: PaaI family thioesterase [Rhodococcus]MDV7241632.1 PaaI family thioesterase [Rhodococcus oxybenzonivorans]MDV7264217.1 PaaI family thioesterase [Rhodococcus oxybenzonivorans]MDV7273835.1 PaaI family thioesterase [Rhodococcus oxybenzonivorans]MDV7333913.1 PaaI family thioesterase [Rhodococcus oxybenzonivorans]MDV7343332.1 PaaI family thioesterase [Rhodococcus oxybenzonivorans]
MNSQRSGLCGGCRSRGTCQMGIAEIRLDPDGTVRAPVRLSSAMEGGPGVAHGGWTAAVFDEVLGQVPLQYNVLSVTKTLTINYLRPVPIERDLVVEATIVARQDGRWELTGRLVLDATGADLATASGIWIERDQSHFDRHRHWLRSQDALADLPAQSL